MHACSELCVPIGTSLAHFVATVATAVVTAVATGPICVATVVTARERFLKKINHLPLSSGYYGCYTNWTGCYSGYYSGCYGCYESV